VGERVINPLRKIKKRKSKSPSKDAPEEETEAYVAGQEQLADGERAC
jgi:hypothetical protein